MMASQFWKLQTIGNDFVTVPEGVIEPQDLEKAAVQLCSRGTGIGSDGLLVVGKASNGLSLRMFNPDGTEDFCGNGLRCAGLFGHRQGWVGSEFSIDHGDQSVPCQVDPDLSVTIELAPASFEPSQVPVSSATEFFLRELHGVKGTALTTGSTHFVALVDQLPSDEEFLAVSPKIEHDDLFPDRTSVIYALPIKDRTLLLRIWERGVGETLGCGTGSSAAAVVWSRVAGLSGEFDVQNPGGTLKVRLNDWQGPVWSTSSPKVTFTGSLSVRTNATTRGPYTA